jgi:hypothetical protein
VVGFRRFVGGGCGKLRRKCGAWATILVKGGCPWIAVVHDLDEYDEAKLRADLEEAIAPARARVSVVLIPKREIEAWLLYDSHAIASAFREKRVPKIPGQPESLDDPKKCLRDLVHKTYGKVYLHTVHNARIAKYIDTSLLTRAQSFAPHFAFTTAVKNMLH